MTDATTRQHARPHLDADPLEVALEAWRRGQPCDLPTLTRAGAITIGQAHEAWRAGLWRAPECLACNGHGGDPCSHDDIAEGFGCWTCQGSGIEGPPCELCLGTGLQWSERHAELLAYAGEESLRLGDEQRLRVALRGADGVTGFVEELRHWSDLAPLAAAWGVAREWARGRASGLLRGALDRAALAAVWRYLCDPSEALSETRPGVEGTPVYPLSTAHPEPDEAVRRASADLGEEAAIRAAREGVRRWAGRVWGVDGAPL